MSAFFLGWLDLFNFLSRTAEADGLICWWIMLWRKLGFFCPLRRFYICGRGVDRFLLAHHTHLGRFKHTCSSIGAGYSFDSLHRFGFPPLICIQYACVCISAGMYMYAQMLLNFCWWLLLNLISKTWCRLVFADHLVISGTFVLSEDENCGEGTGT